MGERELSLGAKRVTAALCALILYGQKRTLFGSKKGFSRPLLSHSVWAKENSLWEQKGLQAPFALSQSWVVEPLSLNLRPVLFLITIMVIMSTLFVS